MPNTKDRVYLSIDMTEQRQVYWNDIVKHVEENAPYLGDKIRKTMVFDFMLAFTHRHIKDAPNNNNQ